MKRALPILMFPVLLLAGVASFSPLSGEGIDVSSELRNLKSRETARKMDAAVMLGKSRGKAATAALLQEIKTEKDRAVRVKMVESLAAGGDATAAGELEKLLKGDSDPRVRKTAAFSLGYARSAAAVPSLINAFLNDKEDLGVRLQSADALTNYPATKEIYDCYIKGTENDSATIRIQALTSLSLAFSATERNRVVPVLKRLAADKDATVGKAAKDRLRVLGIE